MSREEIRAIFLDVMAKNKITPQHVPTERVFDYSRRKQIEKSSRRYFVVKGFAKFRCPKHRAWPSAHSWCFVDLKTLSIVHRYKQSCKRCNFTVEPIFVDEDVLENMLQNGVSQFMYRRGWKKRPKRKNTRRMTRKVPHDTRRCSRCKDKRRNCSKI